MLLERARELVQDGLSFNDAVEGIRSTSVFMTHTPVADGHDVFLFYMVEKHFSDFWKELGITRERFLDLGTHEGAFNMTALALRMSGFRNAVSELNGRVARRMWHVVCPEERAPIVAITNGVHVPIWIAPQFCSLFARHVEPDWVDRHDDTAIWDRVVDIPDDQIWRAHLHLKRKFLAFVRARAKTRWSEHKVSPVQVVAMGTLLDSDALTIGVRPALHRL